MTAALFAVATLAPGSPWFPHLAALRATTDLLAALSRIGKSKDRTIVALDRIRPKGIEDAACAKFLERKIDVVVPYAEKADAAADLGVPYVLAEMADTTSHAIKQLGEKLGPSAGPRVGCVPQRRMCSRSQRGSTRRAKP